MFPRHITPRVLQALGDSPVVLLHGARQTGKTTLARHIASGPHRARYLTLDDATVLAAAQADPVGFVAGLNEPVVIDEVQRAPGLFVAIKAQVDRRRQPGRFLVTGSANVLLVPQLSESLVGRMEVLTLWPLSQGEIEGAREAFVDRLFRPGPLPPVGSAIGQQEAIRRLLAGGYPEAVERALVRRRAWFGSYLTTVLQRDVRDLSQRIERISELPRLLAVLAARTGTLLNVADLSRVLGIPQSTLGRYLTLLQTTFLIHLVPAWTANVRKRLLRSPKVILVDTGLATHLLGVDRRGLVRQVELWGGVLETFVLTELLKQMTWSNTQPLMYHLRTAKGEEVDAVLEDAAGRIVGVEVKAAASIGTHDFRGLRALAAASGQRFHRGVLMYLGEEAVPFGSRLHALPLSSIWHMNSAATSRSQGAGSGGRSEKQGRFSSRRAGP